MIKVAELALAMDAYEVLAIHGASAVRGRLRATPRPDGYRRPRHHRRPRLGAVGAYGPSDRRTR